MFRWERGADRPGERYRLLIRAVLGLPPPPAAPANGTAQATPAPASGGGPAPALTVTISIQLPPGITADITTGPPS